MGKTPYSRMYIYEEIEPRTLHNYEGHEPLPIYHSPLHVILIIITVSTACTFLYNTKPHLIEIIQISTKRSSHILFSFDIIIMIHVNVILRHT